VHINLYQLTFVNMLKNMLLQDVYNSFDRNFGEDTPIDVNDLDTFVA